MVAKRSFVAVIKTFLDNMAWSNSGQLGQLKVLMNTDDISHCQVVCELKTLLFMQTAELLTTGSFENVCLKSALYMVLLT